MPYSTVPAASRERARVAGAGGSFAGGCPGRPQGRKPPAQQVGRQPPSGRIPYTRQPLRRHARRLSPASAGSPRRSQPSSCRRPPPPPLPAESRGLGPVGSRCPPRPSRDPGRRGTEGKSPSLPGPRCVTPGRSYRERAPASRAAESEVQLVLWPGGAGPQQRSPGPGEGGGGRGTNLKGVTWSLKAQRIQGED